MKNVLLWDPRFPDRQPTLHFVDDLIASAIVRSGIGAIADARDPGVFSGGSLDPSDLVEVVVQVGLFKATTRLLLPLSVVTLIVQAGLGSAVEAEIAAPPAPVTITLASSLPQIVAGSSGTADLTIGGNGTAPFTVDHDAPAWLTLEFISPNIVRATWTDAQL